MFFSVHSFKSNIYNDWNAIGTNQWRLDDCCPCRNMRQSTPLAGKMCYLLVRRPHKRRYKTGKGWPRPGAFGKAKILSFSAVVVSPPFSGCPDDVWEASLKVMGGWWRWIHMGIQLDQTPSRNTRKITSRTNQKGYDNSKTTVGKRSTRRIQIFRVHFLVIYFWPHFQNNLSKNVQTKTYPEESDLPRQILLFRGLRPFWGASVCLGIIFFNYLRKSSWFARAR